MPYLNKGLSFIKRGPYISYRELREREHLQRATTDQLKEWLTDCSPVERTRINRELKERR